MAKKKASDSWKSIGHYLASYFVCFKWRNGAPRCLEADESPCVHCRAVFLRRLESKALLKQAKKGGK